MKPTRAGLAVDDDDLAGAALDGLARDPRSDIRRAARRETHDDVDRLLGHPLGPRRRGGQQQRTGQQTSTQHGDTPIPDEKRRASAVPGQGIEACLEMKQACA